MKRLTPRLARTVYAVLLLLAFHAAAFGQDQPLRIKYWLGMSQPAAHLFEVTIEVELPRSKPRSIDFQMPRWSPGRYAVFDFAKNVQEVRAREACPAGLDCTTPDLAVVRVDDQTWRVELSQFSPPGLSLMFSYKVFANDLSGTFSQLDQRHANFNGGCIFMYVVNHKQDPVALSINAPKGWRVVNSRTAKQDQTEFQFPNWDIMTDTPTEVAPDWTQDDFQLDGKQYHVVVHSFGREGGKRAALVRDIEKIVRTEIMMWGPPEFESYTFLIHFANDGHSSDGMEHLTSTQIIEPGALGDGDTYQDVLDSVAHEFFHVWNVKRLRPVELGPWDFTRPANTRGLWIAEGITNYYGHLMQRRAGIWDDAKFLATLTEQIDDVENSPGSKVMSAEESSLSAPFLDDAVHAQQTNLANTSVSYYPKGELLGLVLDLLIRGNTNGKASLDDVMRHMYEEYYLKAPYATYYLRGRGYRNEDFERVVSEFAGADMSDFFKHHVRGVRQPPYEEAFRKVGLRFVKSPRSPVTLGVTASDTAVPAFKVASVRPSSPAATAGFQPDDVITTFGGAKFTSDNFLKILARHKPGDRVQVTLRRNQRPMSLTVVLAAPEVFDYRIDPMPNASAEAIALRRAWLSGKN